MGSNGSDSEILDLTLEALAKLTDETIATKNFCIVIKNLKLNGDFLYLFHN